nr:MAG TPA: hypothetical protein [Caudoviricetes sp.]
MIGRTSPTLTCRRLPYFTMIVSTPGVRCSG